VIFIENENRFNFTMGLQDGAAIDIAAD